MKDRYKTILYFPEPPRGGTGFSNYVTDRVARCHLIGVCRVPRAGLEAWLGVHITLELELELEPIQTQMAQKPMLRAEVYAHAMRASQNRKKEVRRE